MDSIYSAASSASRAVFGETTGDPNRAERPTRVTDAATTDTTAHTDTNPFRGNVSTTTADPFRHATDTGGSGTRHTGGSTYTAKPTTTTTSAFEKPSIGDLNNNGVRHNTSDTDRPFGATIRSEERPTISDTGILPPVHHQSAQKPLGAAGHEHGGLSEMTGASDTHQPHTNPTGIMPASSTATGGILPTHHQSAQRPLGAAGREHGGLSEMTGVSDTRQPHTTSTGIAHVTPSTVAGEHHASNTRDRTSVMPGAFDPHTQQSGSGLSGPGLSGTHDQQSHTRDRAHEQSGSGLSGSGLTGQGLSGTHGQQTAHDHQQSGSGLSGPGLSGTHDQQSHTRDRAHEQSGSGLSGSGLTGQGLSGNNGQQSHTDDRTHEHEHSGTRDHQQSDSHEQRKSSSDLHTPSTTTTSTQPKPSTRIGPAIAALPTAPQSTESGTGEKYEKSTGVAAEGGDFDASRPGAGREADRLLDQHGIHHGPEKKDVAEPAAGVPSHKKDMHKKDMDKKDMDMDKKNVEHHEPAAHAPHAEEEHKGLGEKIKEKLHLGHH